MAYNSFKYRILFILTILSFGPSSWIKAENFPVNFPSWFMKNQGQFSNNSRYSLKSSNSNTFFFDQYIVHQFIASKVKSDTLNKGILNVRIDFENSNQHPTFRERDPQTAKSNFFTGNDASKWETDISLFRTLAYQNLYNNIDLVYYNAAKSKKSDFVVHPGGNYQDISLRYSGINNLSINQKGALLISTDAGEITEHIPEAYQIINGNKIPVKADFVLGEGFRVKFNVTGYDSAYELIIDPQLIYSSFFGGSNDDTWPTEIVRDSHQNIYFAGKTMSSDFPTTAGAFSNVYSGDYDAFVLKFDPTGTKLIFSSFFGGTGQDLAVALKLVGPSDDILVLGLASGGGFPTTAGAYQTVYGGVDDIFLLKLNNAGNNLIFSTLIGGYTDEQANDFCIDKNGDYYILGYAGADFPVTSGAYQQTLSGDYDLCVFKLSADGKSLLYSTFIGGPYRDRNGGIAIDDLSNVYITGWTQGDFPTTAGAFGNTYNGGSDMVACEFDPTLSKLIFSTLIGGSGEDLTVSKLILDKDKNLIFTGSAGAGFPTTIGSFDQSFNGGNTDAIVIKLKNDGSQLLYSSFLGGPGNDFARDFTVDGSGNLVITGSCGDRFPVTKCPYDDTFNGGYTDCFISILDINNSELKYSTYFGGSQEEEGWNVTCSGDTILMTGATRSTDLPVTPDAYDKTYNGSNDIFFIKLLPGAGDKPVADFSNPADFCVNQPVNFTNTSVNSITYIWDFGDGYSSTTLNPMHSYSIPGDYSVALIAINACSSDTTSAYLKINGFTATNSVSLCSGDSILIDGVYRHNEGNYDKRFLTIIGCDSIITTNLKLNPIKLTSQNPAICNGEIFVVGTHIYNSEGIYVDLLKTVLGCDSIITTNLIVYPTKQTNQNSSICEGEIFAIGTHEYTTTGTYSDTLKTISGCDSLVTTNLAINPKPVITLGNDVILCPGDSIILSPGSGFTKYIWSDGSVLSDLKIKKPGNYEVTVFNQWCSSSDQIAVYECRAELWFPNAFSPNDDGKNDHFRPVIWGTLNSYRIMIYNRWGQLLYESSDAYNGWDGTFNGSLCPGGLYVYVAEYSIGIEPYSLKQKVKRGTVTLIR